MLSITSRSTMSETDGSLTTMNALMTMEAGKLIPSLSLHNKMSFWELISIILVCMLLDVGAAQKLEVVTTC